MNKDTKFQNGSVDMDSIVERIKVEDSNTTIPDGDIHYSSYSHVEEAISRLRTLQLIEDTKKNAEHVVRITDAFCNPAAKTGWGEDNLINATEYPMTRLTQDWQLLTSLYRTSWIIQRVCNVIPEDALADLMVEAPGIEAKDLHKLEEEIRSTHLRESILEGLRWGRLYGGAAGIIMLSGQEEDLSLPIDINNIMPGSFRGLYIVDRWSGIYPSLTLVTNEHDPDFGLPEFYEVRDETGGGSYRVHHSRVLRFTGIQMPYWEQVAEQYWGTSAIESLYDELVTRDNVSHNIANLTFKANLNVLKVENLDQMFATSSTVHQRRMYAMLSAISTIENSMGVRLINSTDDIQQLQYSFSGLPEVMDTAMMNMAGATAIPVTRLFGRSPAGMNSTGESDEKMYRQTLEQERAVHITPVLERLIPIVCHSAIGCFPAGASFKYPPLIEISPQEKASLIDQQIQPLERMFQMNLLPGDAVLEGLRNAQIAMDIVSPIRDEHIDKVRGKYQNELQQQADPYGGAMQAAGEVGAPPQEGQVDENGNPIEPQVDENGNPIEPQVDENGNPIEQSEQSEEEYQDQINAEKVEYNNVANQASPDVVKKELINALNMQNVPIENIERGMKQAYENVKKQKERLRKIKGILRRYPSEVPADALSQMAVESQIPIEQFEQELFSQGQPQDEGQAQQGEEMPQEEQQAQEQPQEAQRTDSRRRVMKAHHKHNHWDDDFDDYTGSKMEKIRKRRKRDWS